jgi:hypothetical protein
LNGEDSSGSSMGLTGVESENGFRIVVVAAAAGVGSGDAAPAGRYGGGAVALDADRGSVAAAAATAAAVVVVGWTDRRGLGGVAWEIASLYGGATSSTLWLLACILWTPSRELALRILPVCSRLRRLLLLENRPPINNSASKENARRCLVHFLPDFFGGLFSEMTPALVRFLLRRAQQSARSIATMTARTTGTAIAA